MTEREIVRVVCATCTGKRPIIARVVDLEDGPRFRAKFRSSVVTATIREGDGLKSAQTRYSTETTDLAIGEARDGLYRCGCPNGHGVVAIEEAVLGGWIAESRRARKRQDVEVVIAPSTTKYRLE